MEAAKTVKGDGDTETDRNDCPMEGGEEGEDEERESSDEESAAEDEEIPKPSEHHRPSVNLQMLTISSSASSPPPPALASTTDGTLQPPDAELDRCRSPHIRMQDDQDGILQQARSLRSPSLYPPEEATQDFIRVGNLNLPIRPSSAASHRSDNNPFFLSAPSSPGPASLAPSATASPIASSSGPRPSTTPSGDSVPREGLALMPTRDPASSVTSTPHRRNSIGDEAPDLNGGVAGNDGSDAVAGTDNDAAFNDAASVGATGVSHPIAANVTHEIYDMNSLHYSGDPLPYSLPGTPRFVMPQSPKPPTPPPGTYATLYIKPVMPGYIMEMGQSAPFKNKADGGGDGGGSRGSASSAAVAETDCDNVSWRGSIPCMPKPLAIALCVCNVVVPGLGTFLSGWSTICISRVRLPRGSRLVCITINAWVAFLQMITTFLFLAGWFWSLYWAAIFVSLSEDWRARDEDRASRGASSKVTPEPPNPGGDNDAAGNANSAGNTVTEMAAPNQRRASIVSAEIAKRELEAELDALERGENDAAAEDGAGRGCDATPDQQTGAATTEPPRPLLNVRMQASMTPMSGGAIGDGGHPGIGGGGDWGETLLPYPGMNPQNRRQMQMARRQGRLPPLVLTRERLEELVLNDGNRVMAREAARTVPGALPPPPVTRSERRGRHARENQMR